MNLPLPLDVFLPTFHVVAPLALPFWDTHVLQARTFAALGPTLPGKAFPYCEAGTLLIRAGTVTDSIGGRDVVQDAGVAMPPKVVESGRQAAPRPVLPTPVRQIGRNAMDVQACGRWLQHPHALPA